MSQRSVKVAVHLKNHETVEGWDYGKTPLGYYVALDPTGTNIRFVPNGTYSSVSWNHEAERAKFPDGADIEVDVLAEQTRKFEGRLRRPLELLDYNQIRRLASHLRQLHYSFHDPDSRAGLHDITATYDAHISLFEQLHNSGLEEVFHTDDELLRSCISRHILLAAEADVVHMWDIDSMVATVRQSSERPRQSELLSIVTPESIENYVHSPHKSDADDSEQSSVRSRRLKIVSATGKFALGGLFASANLGLGVFAGVVSALPTLTMGTVSAAVGVAASTYTGLNTSLDALKDMAALIEKPKKG